MRKSLARIACLVAVVAAVSGRAAASPYAQTVMVSINGVDFADPVAAMDSITDASADKPYVIRIAPGVYMLPRTLVGKPYVDIEGAGEHATVLLGDPTRSWQQGTILELVANQEVRFLTVKDASRQTCGDGRGLVTASGPGTMRFVTVDGNSRTTGGTGIAVSADALFDHVTVSMVMSSYLYGGTAVYHFGGSPRFTHCTLTASAENGGLGMSWALGLLAYSPTPNVVTIEDSSLYGTWAGIYTLGPPRYTTVRIRNSTVKNIGGHYAIQNTNSSPGMSFFVSGSIMDGQLELLGAGCTIVSTYTSALSPFNCY